MRAITSAVIPEPVSAAQKRAVGPSTRVPTSSFPPCGIAPTALKLRFKTTSRHSDESPTFITSPGASMGQLAVRDVAHENHHARNAAVMPQRRRVRVHAADASVSAHRTHFELFLFAAQGALQDCLHL